MLWPSYCETWDRRLDEIEALETLTDWASHTGAYDIDFIVFAIDKIEEPEIELVPFIYRNRY